MKEYQEKFFSVLCENDFTSEIIRRFFLVILGDEAHGVLRLTKPGSLQHAAVSNVIALLRDNCNDIHLWQNAAEAAWDAGMTEVEEVVAAAWVAAEVAETVVDTTEAVWDARPAARTAATFVASVAWQALEAADAPDAQGQAAMAAGAHYQWMADKLIQLLKETA